MAVRRGPRRLQAAAVAMSAVLVTACGGDGTDSSGSAGQGQAGQDFVPMTFSLDFNFDGLHSPFIVADDKGWYDEAGLDVTIQPSGGSQDSLTRIATGTAQMGIVSAPVVLTGIANEQLPVKVVAVLLQHNAAATESLKSLNVSEPADLEGLTVATPSASSQQQFFPALLEANGVDASAVNKVSISPAAAKQTLLAGQVDATNIFGPVFSDVTDRVNIMYWYKFGLDTYGSTITAGTDFIDEHPQQVTTFLEVSMRGLEYVIEHPEEAGALVAERAQSGAEFFKAEVKEFIQFYDVESAPNGPGTMEDGRWQATQDLNVKFGAQNEEVPLDTVYTNEYLTGAS